MREILTILRGNFRKNKGHYIGVFILMLIVSVSITTVLTVFNSARDRVAEQVERVGLGDEIASVNIAAVSGEDNWKENLIDKISGSSVVDNVKYLDCAVVSIENINGNSLGNSTFILDYKNEYFSYNIYDDDKRLVEDPELAEDEIIVPISFNALYDAELGDTVVVGNEINRATYKIKYYMEDPYMGSSMMGIKTLLLSDKGLNNLYNMIGAQHKAWEEGRIGHTAIEKTGFLSIYKKEGVSNKEFEQKLNEETSFSSYMWITLTKEQSMVYMCMLTDVFSAIMLVFAVLLVVITIIVISHNINSGIELDFVNYGILKAVGISNFNIRLSILFGYVLTLLLGALIGIPLAKPISTAMVSLIIGVVGVYMESNVAILPAILLIGAIIFIISLCALLKTSKINNISPVKAINNGKEDVYFSSILKAKISKKILGISLAYRQFVSGLKQYAGTFVITSILALFVIMINDMWLWSSNEDFIEDLFSPVKTDLALQYKNDDVIEKVEKLIAAHSDYSEVDYANYYFLFDNIDINGLVCEDPNAIHTVSKGRTCLYDNEILVTDFIVENYGFNIGDSVSISRSGNTEEYIISGIYQSANDTGKNFAMSIEGFERLGCKMSYSNDKEYVLDNPAEVESIISEIKEKYNEDEVLVLTGGFDNVDMVVQDTIKVITIIIYILTLMFVAVTVIMVCNKVFIKEKKDYGIYKSLGFGNANLRLQFAAKFTIASIVGSVFGIGLAFLFENKIMSVLFKQFGIYNFESSIGAKSAIIELLFMGVSFFVFAYISARKINKVNPRILIAE